MEGEESSQLFVYSLIIFLRFVIVDPWQRFLFSLSLFFNFDYRGSNLSIPFSLLVFCLMLQKIVKLISLTNSLIVVLRGMTVKTSLLPDDFSKTLKSESPHNVVQLYQQWQQPSLAENWMKLVLTLFTCLFVFVLIIYDPFWTLSFSSNKQYFWRSQKNW